MVTNFEALKVSCRSGLFNFSVFLSHLGILLKYNSDSVGLGWAWDSAFAISSQVILMLQVDDYT